MSRLAKRTMADHFTAAATLRQAPGTWLPVHSYRSTISANSVASDIRTGRFDAYGAAGLFETRVDYVDGEPTVFARYVGDGTEAIRERMPRPETKHQGVAARLQARPGVELPVGDYSSPGSAQTLAGKIRRGELPAYLPAGAYDASWSLNLDRTGWTVFGRYVGESA